uniref:Uncharacterized protein n=1 Tax=Clytia hemisphaerica TaxID=252671 RepID=A0A7M6DP95_9CNID
MAYSDKNGASSCKTCGLGTYPISDYYGRNIGCRNCPIGSIGRSDGKCYNCDGVMEYGDTVGATSCKTCQVGTVPVGHNSYQRRYKCVNCPIGSIGKTDGKCYNCVGVMEYGDTVGATSCKTCQVGTVPIHNSYQRRYKCVNCPIGSIGKTDGKCYNCVGVMEYGDTVGATSCKTCQVGTVPIHNSYQRRYKCVNCPIGSIGKTDGKCYNCVGVMEYGDTVGATSCKTCQVGTVPVHNSYQRRYKCVNCRVGTIGKSDGQCHRCDGVMEYGDTVGATSCKSCPLGTVPRLDYYRYQYGCKSCRVGTIGKSDGKCHRCNGPMEYGDSYGATSCKNCPLGSIPKVDYSRYQYGCKSCKVGTIGKSDGLCHRCNGPMEYGDSSGATSCKNCPLGSIPKVDYSRYQYGCKNCKVGTIGKSDGLCHRCNGPMEYGDSSGATSCKNCPLGSIPKVDYSRYQYGCRQCQLGTIGKSDGKCYKCIGDQQYVDDYGSTTCKICPSNSRVVIDSRGYHLDCKRWK